jgi:hypothetical protein
MSGSQWKMIMLVITTVVVIATVVGIVLVVPRLSLAQSELIDINDQPSRVSITYPTQQFDFPGAI